MWEVVRWSRFHRGFTSIDPSAGLGVATIVRVEAVEIISVLIMATTKEIADD